MTTARKALKFKKRVKMKPKLKTLFYKSSSDIQREIKVKSRFIIFSSSREVALDIDDRNTTEKLSS